ncbi:MAG: hypothetical protein EBX50_12400, partial [Chitinophagia bacterium]|nr:hypothetical protein [Chitinophagia bacterium]
DTVSAGWQNTNSDVALKSTAGWISGNGTNSSGFTGLPGGYRGDGGDFFYLGTSSSWWSSSVSSYGTPFYRHLYNNAAGIFWYSTAPKVGFSVRCIRD